MVRLDVASIVLVAVVASACGSLTQTPVMPTATGATEASAGSPEPSAARAPCTIGFEGLQANGASFDRHSACGLAIAAAGAPWQASTTYGSPAPFVQFQAPAGTTMTGEMVLQSVGGTFTFASADIYSSTTKIPYEITGTLHGTVMFTLAATQGNTFGRFATIVNPHAGAAIDVLRVTLTNQAAPCCSNPMGLDNVRIAR